MRRSLRSLDKDRIHLVDIRLAKLPKRFDKTKKKRVSQKRHSAPPASDQSRKTNRLSIHHFKQLQHFRKWNFHGKSSNLMNDEHTERRTVQNDSNRRLLVLYGFSPVQICLERQISHQFCPGSNSITVLEMPLVTKNTLFFVRRFHTCH